MRLALAALVGFVALVGLVVAAPGPCDGSNEFVEDSELSAMVSRARDLFIQSRPTPVTTFGATLLVKDGSGAWRRGSVNPYLLVYPAR